MFLAVFLAVSCNRSEPKITYGFIELVYYQGNVRPREFFSFFIIPDDEDGIENLADLYLYHDREQLRWHISSEDWVTHTESGTSWIGSRSIAIREGESLPRGQFRAVLINKGGEKSERNFSFDAPEQPVHPFPRLEISEQRYTVTSSYPQNQLVCYDEQGNYVHTAHLVALTGTIDDLNLPSNARTAALWAQDTQRFTSAYTDVAVIR
jgi:hypothetical protein